MRFDGRFGARPFQQRLLSHVFRKLPYLGEK